MAIEMCPHCRVLRNLRVSVSRGPRKGPDGADLDVVTTSYHCATCGSFVRSSDAPAAGPRPPRH
jgi:hypothetical protein